jgi:hypothetical protein
MGHDGVLVERSAAGIRRESGAGGAGFHGGDIDRAAYMQHIYGMKRTTVFFDDQMMLQLQRAAQRSGVSTASLVREAVARYLAAPGATSPLPSIAGQFASGASDTSEQVDSLLWKDPHG